MDKLLSEWTLGEVTEYCEKHKCKECIFGDNCILQRVPANWPLPETEPTPVATDTDVDRKTDKPRLAEILGVDVGERFRVNGESNTYFLDETGVMRCLYSDEKSTSGIYRAINHPESIIHISRLTEAELAICKALGAKWVSRDNYPDVSPELWEQKPKLEGNTYGHSERLGVIFKKDAFPSLHPGDCICVEEAGGDA